MKDEKLLEKNILSLKHSVNQTKAAVFLGLAFSSWIAIFLGLKTSLDTFRALIVASIVAIFFLFKAFQFFEGCEDIQKQIKKLR